MEVNDDPYLELAEAEEIEPEAMFEDDEHDETGKQYIVVSLQSTLAVYTRFA